MKRRQLVRRKRRSPDSEDEMYILAFAIMHDEVAESLHRYYKDGQLKMGLLTPSYVRQYRSVLKFYKKYHSSPRRAIKFIHESQKIQLRDEDIQIDEALLEVVALEYAAAKESYDISPKYVIGEMIPRFIRSRSIKYLERKIEQAVTRGDMQLAESNILKYRQITDEVPDPNFGFTEPLTIEYHQERIKRLADEGGREVYSFDPKFGAISYLFGPLKRQWLVSISGSTKSGKSYFLLDIAIDAAIMQKRKVMVISPEMTEDDMIEERINAWITEKAVSGKTSGISYVPEIDCINNQMRTCQVLKKPLNKKPIAYKIGEKYSQISADDKACRKWKTCDKCRRRKKQSTINTKRFIPAVFQRRQRIRSYNNDDLMEGLDQIKVQSVRNLKIKYFPKYSVTIEEVLADIESYQRKHRWKPDIVIFDYIDILRPSSDSTEIRWQDIDHMWKTASGFAQKMNCLAITADQTTKEGRQRRLLDQMSTPGASHKDHHVNAKFGIVKHENETRNNICRINNIYHRHRAFDRNLEVLVIQNLTICHAVIDSVFWFDKNMPPYTVELPQEI